MKLTEAQIRVLTHLARFPRFHPLVELDQTRLLADDDIVVIPSLDELGLVERRQGLQAVRITTAGKIVLKENKP